MTTIIIQIIIRLPLAKAPLLLAKVNIAPQRVFIMLCTKSEHRTPRGARNLVFPSQRQIPGFNFILTALTRALGDS